MFKAGMAAGLAAYAIQDLMREAEAQRLSNSVHAAHAGLEGTTARWLTHGALAAERFFHVARREVRQGLGDEGMSDGIVGGKRGTGWASRSRVTTSRPVIAT